MSFLKQNYRVLIVDDAEINRSMLTDMLSGEYEVMEAADGQEAVALLEKRHADISLVLLDIIMPQMSGFEVLAFMNKSAWLQSVPVIMISSDTSSASVDQAYDLGATDYISRPFDEKTVRRRVKNTLMLYAKQKMLEELVTEQILEKEQNSSLMVDILSNIVEFRNGESGLHVLHIRTVTELLLRHLVQMGKGYDLTPAQIGLIVNASSLHDIGKISIPEEILNKPGKLTPEEFEIIKTHSAIGAQILERAPRRQNEELVQTAWEICRWHHERYDGGGYPDGLAGEKIPISAQVVALADVYDALTSERIYKPPYSHEKAISMIHNGECGAFNPVLLQCLQEVGPRIRAEMVKSVPEQLSRAEAAEISAQILSTGGASNRTLALLEQERIKYQFFASMSQEIQYEYSFAADLLTLSEWGAQRLGLEEIIAHPMQSAALKAVFPLRDLRDLYSRLQNTTPENPIVTVVYQLNTGGEPRWYKAAARPLWVGEEEPMMTGVIGKFSDIHEEQLQLQSLRQKAEQDSLTKLYNHMFAREQIERTLAAGKKRTYALILLDLDLFKSANDRYGHLFGDAVLKNVAGRIVSHIRAEDIASRIGGDEFLIFTSYQEQVEPIVKRLFRDISGEYAGFDISLSMGVAVSPQNGESYEQLFHCADQALYAAKHRGRQRYCFYDDSVRGSLSVLSPMETDLDP